MKSGFIGVRIDQAEKAELMKIAVLENMSLSDLVELLVRRKIHEFRRNTLTKV